MKLYKKNIKKISIIFSLIVFICCFGIIATHVLASKDNPNLDNGKNLGVKTINDPKYIWTIDFTIPGNVDSVKNNMQVRELNGNDMGKKINVSIKSENNDKSVKIIPLNNGYEVGKSYRIIVEDGAKSKNNVNIKRPVFMDFRVIGQIEATLDIQVSSILPMFKKIMVNTKLDNITQFKIEGNNNFLDMGKEMVTLASNNSKIYFYDINKKLIGQASIDLSKSGTFNIIAQ